MKLWKRTVLQISMVATAILLVLLVLFGLIYFVQDHAFPRTFAGEVGEYSFAYGVDANFVFAVIKQESNFDERAVSKKGAQGLMQIMPATEKYIAKKLGVSDYDIFDPETNIRFGTWYISYLYYRFGSYQLAAVAYNAGEGTLRGWLSKYSDHEGNLTHIPYPETQKYVENVMKYYEQYRLKYYY
jgi:transglycosylase, SLT family